MLQELILILHFRLKYNTKNSKTCEQTNTVRRLGLVFVTKHGVVKIECLKDWEMLS
jgi:hypothetical protein